MKIPFRSGAVWFALLTSTLLSVPGFAQVPQDMTYTGRLVDGGGTPLAGPVNLELRIFDAETAGTQLYSEQHLGTVLDATGGFSVQLGLGTSPVGTFDAALFSDVDRWLEVVVGAVVLTVGIASCERDRTYDKKVIVIGMDGMDPRLCERMMDAG